MIRLCLIFLIFFIWGLTAVPVWAEESAPAPQCREGIYGTWYPYSWGGATNFGKIIIENERIFFENKGGWLDYVSRKTQTGKVYFIPEGQRENGPRNEEGMYFAVRNPARLEPYRNIPCAIELVKCAYKDWIVAAVENETESRPDDGGPIAGGNVYCGHISFTPEKIPGALKRP